MDYILNLNALLAHIISNHSKHKAVEDRLSTAKEIVVPDLLIVELHWVVLSRRYPEINTKAFEQVLDAIRNDPSVRVAAVTPNVAAEQTKWYKQLSFFDAYYAAFSIIHGKKLLTTDPDFEPYDFAEVI
ncbi:MAG: type II toxin-antitoxin system VapC family toxin [Candidatus Bathyarchaeia archaeon]